MFFKTAVDSFGLFCFRRESVGLPTDTTGVRENSYEKPWNIVRIENDRRGLLWASTCPVGVRGNFIGILLEPVSACWIPLFGRDIVPYGPGVFGMVLYLVRKPG